MDAPPTRKPRDTGPHELRDFGPTGHRLGTPDDCYDGSPWELHRGELREQIRAKDTHGIVMALLAALFRTHARLGITVMADVYCDLSDATSKSIRAPDVMVVRDLLTPKNDIYSGTPVLAVEIRGTQSKPYLREKVELYLEHGWLCTWIVHVEREEVEVIVPGAGSVVYTVSGAPVPLPEDLNVHGLTALPVAAFFQASEARRYNDDWVAGRSAAQSVMTVLVARGFEINKPTQDRILESRDLTDLQRWLAMAATAPSIEAFVSGVGQG
ncbi:MAG: Uma2 family endonuclease [Polyangiaceae bacterium]|nr:Uma2 family endonuclease [Polyangiaceae bacterium]